MHSHVLGFPWIPTHKGIAFYCAQLQTSVCLFTFILNRYNPTCMARLSGPQTPFHLQTSKYTGRPSLLVADPMTLAYCLRPNTLLYHSDAETENRLPKPSSVSGWQQFQHQLLQRPHTRRTDCLPHVDKPTLLPPPKLFGDVMFLYAAVNGELHADN